MASGRSGHATYYLDLYLISQNQVGNFSTINIHGYTIADSGWSGFSNTPIGWSVSTGATGAVPFSGTSIQWFNFDFNIGHDARGYASGVINSHTNATGTTSFGGPMDLSQGFSLPRIPKIPTVPTISGVMSGRNVTLTVGPTADNGGSAVTSYVTQYSVGGGWIGTVSGTTGQRTYSNLAPDDYVFRAYAVNAIGNGYAANTGTFVVKPAGGKIRKNGLWVPATDKVSIAGVKRDASIKVRVSGAWKDAS